MTTAKEKLDGFDEVVKKMRDTIEAKNQDYGDDNIGRLGEKGCFVRMADKVARLKQLIWDDKEGKVADETVEDTLMDLANYAIITVLLRRKKW